MLAGWVAGWPAYRRSLADGRWLVAAHLILPEDGHRMNRKPVRSSLAMAMARDLLARMRKACVHTPPPPSNQIIHVLPKSPAKGLRSMDTVWVSGVLKSVQADTYMGAASWRLEALSVAPYDQPRR
jgi:hypothetical protein